MQVYGLTGRPVIVTDVVRHWNILSFVEELEKMSLRTYRELHYRAVELGTKNKVFGSFFDILYTGVDLETGQYLTPENFYGIWRSTDERYMVH